MKKLRLGIIGCGNITNNMHIPSLKEIPELFEVTALCDTDPEALLKNEKVRARMKEQIEEYSGHFKGFEGVKDFALIAEDFTAENGMLTPSLKVKRRTVLEKWGDTLNALYAKKDERQGASATSAS